MLLQTGSDPFPSECVLFALLSTMKTVLLNDDVVLSKLSNKKNITVG